MTTRTFNRLWKGIVATTLALIAATGAQAALFNYTTPVNSNGNNFTMVSSANGIIGGTNDVVFTWDGTLYDAVPAGPGAASNATMTSDEAFFNSFWDAHDIMLYGPGTYTVFDGCPAGDPGCGVGNAVNFTVGANQIGAHILFNWPAATTNPNNLNIDVVLVWNFRTTWNAVHVGTTDSPFYAGSDDGTACSPQTTAPATGCVIDGSPNTGATSFDLVSTDLNGDGIAGAPMTDGAFAGSYANFNFSGVNFPPAASDLTTSTSVDTPLNIDLAALTSDPDGTVVPASVAIVPASGPANGAVVNNGDGTVTYTPNLGFVSPPTESFQYTIDDNLGATSNAGTININVLAFVNTPPTANDTVVNTLEDTPTDIDVNSVATDPDAGQTLTFANFDANSTMGGTVVANGANTILTYTPAPNFNGADTFTFSVNDGFTDSNTATITVNVVAVNDAPVCTDVGVNTDPNTALDIDVAAELLSTCTDADGDPISLDSTTQPTVVGSTLSFDGLNTLTYTPATDFIGQDTFTYTATDGMDPAAAQTVTVDVGKVFGNFTMLNPSGETFGGTNDVVFTWDGTCYNSVADADAGPANMTMGSESNFPFFGFPWDAHDIKVYCPGGPYTVDTCNPGVAPPLCGPMSMTVPAGHLGAHILFDWNVTDDIDVMIVWNNSTGGAWDNIVPTGQLFQGPAGPTPALDDEYDWISVDADGDGIPGIQFEDGPFIDFRANFNFDRRSSGSGPIEIPESSVPSPNLGSSNGCSISNGRPTSILGALEWWMVFGFIGAIGAVRLKRAATRT